MTYYKCDNKDKEILDKASEITSTNYFEDNGELKVDSLISCIEDLMLEIDRLNEKYDDLQQDVKDNYERISANKQYDIYDDYFLEK